MNKIIKLTERQIYEAIENDDFQYLNDNDIPHNDGNVNITVGGRLNDDEYSKPITTDKISQTIGKQQYPNYGNFYYTKTYNTMKEGIDNNNDGIDDFYNNKEMDVLSNGNPKDNITRIPASVDEKLDNLINVMNMNNLSIKQQAMVLNKIIESIPTNMIPPIWKKELMLKLNSKK